ncbi:hypothetical protein ACQKLP_15385 [Chitinophaga sp. NPDC101104]|uniref:hypothetical protein n=1 Tax=Chitinophaga sp. NPDC101104 TaxID=3390561 RepID=UPI003D070DFB
MKVTDSYLNHLPFGKFVKLRNLWSFDAFPLLEHFRMQDGTDYFSYWIDLPGKIGKRMFWQVAPQDLSAFFKGSLSLRDLILGGDKDAYRFVFEVSQTGEFKDGTILTAGKVPQEYCPDEESFYV